MSVTSIAGLFLVFLLAYLYKQRTTEGRTRLIECYLVMAVGLIAELTIAGFYSLTLQPDVIGYVITTNERIASFLGFLNLLFYGFIFMWLDLLRQFLRLHKMN